MKNQRKIALEILLNQEEKNLLLKDLLLELESSLTNQEYGFVRTIIYGTIRYKIRLDYILDKMSKIKLTKIHKPILIILRLSLYQLIYMEHIKVSAVINEAVELAKIYGNKGSVSFVNGLLRNFVRNKESMLEINLKGLNMLSVKYSMPLWIIKLLSFRSEDIESTLTNFNSESAFSIRPCSLNVDSNILIKSLGEKGFEITDGKLSESSLIINNPSGIFSTNEYFDGEFYVQSDASQYVSQVSDVMEGMNILDMCAAPGGKTGHMYELSKGKAEVTACDVSQDKVNLLSENFKRLKYDSIVVQQNDAMKLNSEFINKFDLVLLDAPCSSLGLISKMPELKYNKEYADIITLSNKQRQMLNNAYKYVKKGGIIIYSTCTFTKEENENLITDFINENSDLYIEEIHGTKTFYVDPVKYNTDAFCVTKIRKEA